MRTRASAAPFGPLVSGIYDGILRIHVSLSIGKPTAISMLNALPGHVTAVREATGPAVDVQLGVGNVTLVARITRRSLQQLGIGRGQALYALVKAVSLDQRSGEDS